VHAGTTPIEALPVVKAKGVTHITSANERDYHGFTIDHGLQFKDYGSIQLHLGGVYNELDGTAYGITAGRMEITFQDVSNPSAGVKQLAKVVLYQRSQRSFKINVRGVTTLLITQHLPWCGRRGICGSEVSDVLGAVVGNPPSYVIPSYPASNAIIPANT